MNYINFNPICKYFIVINSTLIEKLNLFIIVRFLEKISLINKELLRKIRNLIYAPILLFNFIITHKIIRIIELYKNLIRIINRSLILNFRYINILDSSIILLVILY